MSTTVIERDIEQAPAKSRRRFGLKRLLLLVVAVAVLAAAAWFGMNWWTDGRFIETTDDAYVGGNVTSIAPHVAGFIEAIPVSDHQLVQAGQLLLRLDPRDYQAALGRARAIVAGAEAVLESLRAQLTLQQSIIQQSAAELTAKSAQADFTATDADRALSDDRQQSEAGERRHDAHAVRRRQPVCRAAGRTAACESGGAAAPVAPGLSRGVDPGLR